MQYSIVTNFKLAHLRLSVDYLQEKLFQITKSLIFLCYKFTIEKTGKGRNTNMTTLYSPLSKQLSSQRNCFKG